MRTIAALKPRSIILTSGTLSPMDSFQSEMGIPFRKTLENPHVINAKQVFISSLPRGSGGSDFDFRYGNRDNSDVLNDLGLSIARVAEITPGGILVFFPSYRTLEQAYDHWGLCGTVDKIEKHKPLFREPKDPAKYQKTMENYYNCIFGEGDEEKRGAILMGVCRGRISEGLDFSDDAARCVIIVGIPYPQMTDARVILKKHYLDRRCEDASLPKEMRALRGQAWYNQQATRAVNQAIGRVIRHVQDYGAIILVDQRYTWRSNQQGISSWLRDQVFHAREFKLFDNRLRAFFLSMKSHGFKPKVQQLAEIKCELDEEEIKIESKKKASRPEPK